MSWAIRPARGGPARPTLLVDGDGLLYAAAFGAERRAGGGAPDAGAAIARLDAALARIAARFDAAAMIIALGHERNFRKALWPGYKANRAGRPQPALLPGLRRYLQETRVVERRDGLEADDCLGILATAPALVAGPTVIVSIDKDMMTVPGVHAKPGGRSAATVTITVGAAAADRAHLMQTLTGDRADGYPGCPGIGPAAARAVLAGPGAPWPKVLRAFRAAGLAPGQALLQARLARILRAEDYDFDRRTPILWTPGPRAAAADTHQRETIACPG